MIFFARGMNISIRTSFKPYPVPRKVGVGTETIGEKKTKNQTKNTKRENKPNEKAGELNQNKDACVEQRDRNINVERNVAPPLHPTQRKLARRGDAAASGQKKRGKRTQNSLPRRASRSPVNGASRRAWPRRQNKTANHPPPK
jgi:hypothetical protein